jgi:uncharacterized protein YyaL (SSP411 family)/aryl-alcohol dehydrogenase-like predicted oxidoreductase
MNQHFVCVKVDREERPDLDDVYMAATMALNQGQGGWPMTVFLTPEQQPFFAGTYFPPDDRYGRPGFPSLLRRIAERWEAERDRIRAQGHDVVEHLRLGASASPGGSLGTAEIDRAAAQLAADFDERFGGFGRAPKFPPSGALQLLLRVHRRTGDARALEMVTKTLDEMARGGMYDHLAAASTGTRSTSAGWRRTSRRCCTTTRLLARTYLEAHQATGEPFYARVAREVLGYVRREMTSPEGGFYSATDADSEGEEGRFFVWTPEQVEAVLGAPDARIFCEYYDVDSRGNWEGHSILNTSRTGTAVAARVGLEPDELVRRVDAMRERLYAARRERVPPALDDKVLTSWNGLMISAFAEGHRVLGDAGLLEAATGAARFVLRDLRRAPGALLHSYRAGTAGIEGFLEDYAYFGEALVDLYEAGGDEEFLRAALVLADTIRRDFAADDGGFYSTAAHGEALVIRPREGHDGATPSANAKAASLLARLGAHFGRDDLRQAAERALGAFGKSIARHPRAFCSSLMAADFLLEGPVELAFVGGAGETADLRRAVAGRYLPNRVIGHLDPDVGSALPLLADKSRVRGRAALFVCRDFACQAPVTEPDAVAEALRASARPAAARLGPAALAGRATAEGTARYAARHADRLPHGFATLGSTGLVVSRLGFGGYRVDDETPAHRRALAHALARGVNLVDSSTNYTDGGSERLVGEVLRALVADGTVQRDEVVLVSKIGYVQGANLELAEQREREGRPFPEMVKYGEGIWHCLHPEFLEDQLRRSRARLGVETLDLCLLHNPEYFLKDEHERSHGTLETRRQEFDARLRAAFAWLEGEVAAGRLGGYGVSSNTVASAADDPEAVSLERMLALTPPGGHLRVLQLPMNLLEAGAVRERNQGPDHARTVLETAAAAGVGVLVNRPLNAFRESGLVRLADPPPAEAAADWEARLARVAALEDEFAAEIASYIKTEDGTLPASQFFRWAHELRGLDAQVKGADHWDQLESQRIVPRVSAVLQALDQGLGGALAEQWGDWRGRFLPELQALLAAARGRAAAKSARSLRIVRDALEPALPAERRAEPMSRLALWVLASTPGVGSVLVGMRREKYVDDALPVLAWPPLAGASEALARTSTTVED